jgi:hypothetical protein
MKRIMATIKRIVARIELFWNNNTYLPLGLIAIAAGAVIWTKFHPQSPGFSITLLALAAGIISVRPKMHLIEKTAWVIILAGFTYQEVKAIKQNDIDNKAIRDSQNTAFGSIVDDLKTSIKNSKDQYNQTVDHVDKVSDHVDGVATTTQQVASTTDRNLKTSKEIWSATTGGDSFPVVIALPYPGPEQDFTVSVDGKYALRDIQIQIVDTDAMNNGLRTLTRQPTPSEVYSFGRRDFPIGDLSVKQTRVILYAQTTFPIKSHYQIFSSALNGSWLEELRITRLDNGEIVSATRVFANGWENDHPVFVKVDEHYPRNTDGSVNWN